jgi:lipopolysaccharide/colanic/teichoic acid biosynthesis glycosyltransferase
MDMSELLIVNENFKYNIKRSIIIKDMKKCNIEEYKIKQKDGCHEIYMKKAGSNKKIKKVYKFKTYNKDRKRKITDNINVNNEITPILKKLKI